MEVWEHALLCPVRCVCLCVYVCVCVCVCLCMCVSMCVFVNCVWFLTSKNDVFMKRNPSVWDETYHGAGKQRYGSRVEVM